MLNYSGDAMMIPNETAEYLTAKLPHLVMPTTEPRWDHVEDWCRDQFGSPVVEWMVKPGMGLIPNRIDPDRSWSIHFNDGFRFKSEKEAIIFKLRWC